MDMNDDEIIRQRIAGKSVRAIAKAQGVSVATVNKTIDRWAATSITDKLPVQSLALGARPPRRAAEDVLPPCA
jgi:transposase